MTALSGDAAPPDASSARTVRGLIAASLRDVRAPIPVVLLLAALPVLLAAWELASPPVMLSMTMTQDLLFNLAGAWQVYAGQLPHVDFHDPSGQLSFLLTALGFRLVGISPFAFLVNVAVVTALLFAGATLTALRRLPLLPAVLFVIFVCLLSLMPANVGDRPDQYTFAMSYNRYGWAAYSVLALNLFVPPSAGRESLRIDVAVVGGLLAILFYFKITYFVAALATVGFAIVVQPHVALSRRTWAALCVLLLANALAPWNRWYIGDILDWSASGAIRTGFKLHFNNFVAGIGQYTPYLASLVLSSCLWWYGRAPAHFPLKLSFLFGTSLFLLTQNSQSAGIPTGIVMLLIVYDELRRLLVDVRDRDLCPLLLALLVFPACDGAAYATSLTGYNSRASAENGLHVVKTTNLRGLAVPAGERGTFLAFSRKFDYPLKNRPAVPPASYQLSEYEYALGLEEAAALLADRTPGGVALLDNVNPLPFMLGWRPARGVNLWSTWSAPLRAADVYLADVQYVLVPKFSLNPNWTTDLLRLYGAYLAENFEKEVESHGWLLLVRAPFGNQTASTPKAAP